MVATEALKVNAGYCAITLLWLSVFGNSALYEIIHGDAAFAEEAMLHPERGSFSFEVKFPSTSAPESAEVT
jgi:choline-glycine betaine transporter